MTENKQLKEHRRWWEFNTPAWVTFIFIIFCITMTIIAAATVASNPDSPVEYKTAHLTYVSGVMSPESGTKQVYWRVKQTEVPRWKRLTNRWHKLEYAFAYMRWSTRTDAEMKDRYTFEEYQNLKKRCLTVGDIRRYEKEQKDIYKKYNWEEVKKARMKKAKEIWKDVD